MAQTLRDELRMRRPFASPEHEAHLGLVRTATVLEDAFERLLRPSGLTIAQFNVLRILRGAEPDGLCRNEVRDRLLTRMPDVTRLLDRMEDAGLVTRERSTTDRRLVTTRITRQGRRIVDDLDEAVARHHEQEFRHLDATQLRTLVDLLALVRQGAQDAAPDRPHAAPAS
jgi:DNA-binding MarR family transcriptional regulator